MDLARIPRTFLKVRPPLRTPVMSNFAQFLSLSCMMHLASTRCCVGLYLTSLRGYIGDSLI